MLLTVRELRDRLTSDISSLVEELSELTGRRGASERYAWQHSLPRLVEALTRLSLDAVHIALEYQLPGTASSCDAVLLGRHGHRASAVIIELKDWDTNRDRPGLAEGLIERALEQELHPSDQLRGYVEYCRRFQSAVHEQDAAVDGFVLLTKGLQTHPYYAPPNDRLVAEFPLFTMAARDLDEALPDYLSQRLTEPDAQFATAFAIGTYRQDRRFMAQAAEAIVKGDTRHFELLDNQRRAFRLCLATTHELLRQKPGARKVIIVEGPPGSGKSAVAAQIWANLAQDPGVPEGNLLLVTTSQSQNSNWTFLIDQAAMLRIGRGLARKATSFTPLQTAGLSRLRKKTGIRNLYKDATKWKEHLADMAVRGMSPTAGAENDSVLVSLVDEAHALINTEREHGVGQFGFVTGLGPQAYHIMRCSRLTVFLLDPEQSFRARENTRVEDIEAWAADLGAAIEKVSLKGAQFRCAGSAEYVAWVDSLLGGASEDVNRVHASAWYSNSEERKVAGRDTQSANVIEFPAQPRAAIPRAPASKVAEPVSGGRRNGRLDFRVYSDPFSMEQDLRELARRYVVRLASTYSRRWKSKEVRSPHRLPPEGMDFCESVILADGSKRTWSRPWNYVPNANYTAFVSGRPGFPISSDPLCEVGCTYAIRGFDFDYLGVLWLDDLHWRDGRWQVPLDNVHESGIRTLVSQARAEGKMAPAGPKGVNVLEKVRQAYRILLTRAIHGFFVWIPDEDTRIRVSRSLGSTAP